MSSRLTACLPIVFQFEGDFVDNPLDKGGPTNMGITIPALALHRGRTVTRQDVIDLPKVEASIIYEDDYWRAAGCDLLPPGVDLAVFDAAVNSSPQRAIRWLQAAAGCPVDGVVGRETLNAVTRTGDLAVILSVCTQRLHFVLGLNNTAEETFEKGWGTRILTVLQRATRMADHPETMV